MERRLAIQRKTIVRKCRTALRLLGTPAYIRSWELRILRRLGVKSWRLRADEIELLVNLTDPVLGTLLFVDRTYEPLLIRIVRGLLSEGQSFVDVGANIGIFSLAAAQCVGPKGKVIAFEPEETNFSYLSRNVERSGWRMIRCEQSAVGETSGSAYLFRHTGNFGSHRVSRHADYRDDGVEEIAIATPLVSLDEYLERAGLAPNVIKIDVEGGEVGALRGMKRALRQDLVILFELWPAGIERQGESPEAVFALLREANLTCYEWDDASREFIPVSAMDLPRLRKRGVSNLVAAREEGIRRLAHSLRSQGNR